MQIVGWKLRGKTSPIKGLTVNEQGGNRPQQGRNEALLHHGPAPQWAA